MPNRKNPALDPTSDPDQTTGPQPSGDQSTGAILESQTAPVDEAAAHVADTAAELASAQKAHNESETAQAVARAQAAHDEAKAAHEALTKEPEAVLGQHILVDFAGTGTYVRRDLSPETVKNFAAFGHPRQLFLDGHNVEHVGEQNGVWTYRKM